MKPLSPSCDGKTTEWKWKYPSNKDYIPKYSYALIFAVQEKLALNRKKCKGLNAIYAKRHVSVQRVPHDLLANFSSMETVSFIFSLNSQCLAQHRAPCGCSVILKQEES